MGIVRKIYRNVWRETKEYQPREMTCENREGEIIAEEDKINYK